MVQGGLEMPLDDVQAPHQSLSDRLRLLRAHINAIFPEAQDGVHRIAVAVYEPESDQLRTYASSGDVPSPLDHYAFELSRVPTLRRLAQEPQAHIIDDYAHHPGHQHHTQRIRDSGLRSGVILPLLYEQEFYGFLFLNSRIPAFFREEALSRLLPYADLARMVAVTSIRKNRVLRGAARTAIAFGRARDEETGSHLARMAEYSRLIALNLADSQALGVLGDEFIEMLYQFAPVHDIGKIAVPDRILLKPGRLTPDEFAQMREHVTHGVAMVLTMSEELGLGESRRVKILRNIVGYHHERLDGSGYPTGASGVQIPLEGRIVAIADVFDALTSERPYKEAWSFEAAEELLHREAQQGKFCLHCIQAFFANREQIASIQNANRD